MTMIFETKFGIKINDDLLVRVEYLSDSSVLGKSRKKNHDVISGSEDLYIIEQRKNLAVRVTLIQSRGSVRSKLTPGSVFAWRKCEGDFEPVVTVSREVASYPSRVAIVSPSGELVCTNTYKRYQQISAFEEDALEDLVRNSRRVLH
jgi:hypothetical protein